MVSGFGQCGCEYDGSEWFPERLAQQVPEQPQPIGARATRRVLSESILGPVATTCITGQVRFIVDE